MSPQLRKRHAHWWLVDGDSRVVVVRFRHVDMPTIHEDAGARAIGIAEGSQGRTVREVLVGGDMPACPVCESERRAPPISLS